MTVDNIIAVRKMLDFQKVKKYNPKTGSFKELPYSFDRYVIHIIHRNKDEKDKEVKNKWKNTKIKTYEIHSIEYFEEKLPLIIDICKNNNARAMFAPQVRDIRDCLDKAAIMCIQARENPTLKFQHLTMEALCAMHKSRNEKWILDLDNKDMCGVGVDDVFNTVKNLVTEAGNDVQQVVKVNTVNGTHIISQPFNTQKFQEIYPMGFMNSKIGYDSELMKEWLLRNGFDKYLNVQNVIDVIKKDPFNIKYIKTALECISKPIDSKMYSDLIAYCKKQYQGWLHKDALTLMYYSDEKQ